MRAFVTASEIAKRLCSPSRDGQELLPQLVARLIKASIPKEAIREFRFPHGDQIYLHGPDGILAVDDDVQDIYVPGGISLWEMGTSTDPKSKADEDFGNAENKLADAFANITPPVTPDKATFVFVTSKPWEANKWISEKRGISSWRSIRVLDAVDLEKWLEQCPAVMLWFADVCGLPAEGLYDAEQYLRKVGIGFGVSPMSPELVVAGRDDNMKHLRELVLQSDSEVHVRGESVEEAAAFLAASSLIEADAYGGKPALVFADTRANLNLLAATDTKATLVAVDSEALERAKTIEGHKWRMVIPEVETIAPRPCGGESLTLARCKRVAIEEHLIEKMKIPEHKAKQIGRDTKGSLIALLWLVGSGPVGTPRWASRKDATTHASLMLAGSWLGSNSNDTEVIELLSRQAYRDIETLLQSAQIPEGPWIHRGVEWVCASRDFVWSQLVGKVTETMLGDFQKIVRDIVGEKDPSLELSPSDRRMASILGKTRKYSSSLRGGLVDSIARLAIFKSDGQAWADRIVRDLLDTEARDGFNPWLSLTDVYSEIGEASPDVFLECLDQMVRSEEGKQFFQDADSDDVLFGPTSAHVYLLWALERLAWQREYFSRVLSILAKMAEIDPGGKRGNSPKNSLITILLPWSPQHAETMQNATQAIKMLYSTSPAVTWDVCIELLPTSYSVTSPTPMPTYREHPGKREVTGKEYWEFVRPVVELMIQWAGKDTCRWASLVKAYPELRRRYLEVGELITDNLAQLNIQTISEANKSVVHDTLRGLIAHHGEYPDTEWALPNSDLKLLESLRERFKPEDAVLQHSYLFSWDPDVLDAPMKQYEDGWDEWLAEKRAQAVKAIHDQDGLAGICHFAEKVELAECVGQAAAELELLEGEVVELFQKGLFSAPGDYNKKLLTRTARAYVSSMYRKEGEKWLEDILATPAMTWTPEAYANLALGLPASPGLWKRFQQWGGKADKLYWRNVEIRGDVRKHWAEVLEKWSEVTRPWSSLELVARLVDEQDAGTTGKKPSAEQVMGILDEALQADESVEPLRQRGAMLRHYAERLFLFLDTQNVDPERMAQLEWGWLRVIEDTKRGAKVLPNQVTSSPKLFVELLKVVYRAEGEPENKTVSENERRLGKQAAHLLQGIHTVPGLMSSSVDKVVDPSVLQEWVIQARKLAQDAGRLQVCDIQIGQILSYAPISLDGSWPCAEVRDLIEEIQSPKLENGLRIGKYNQRGVIHRGKGGQQEWDLVEQYREFAEKVRTGWPRTAGILDGIAKGYENEAREWDEQAKRDEYE